MRFTVQFLAISLSMLPSPLVLRLGPAIIPSSLSELQILLGLGLVFNSSINAIIYLIYNDDMRRQAREMFGLKADEKVMAKAVLQGIVAQIKRTRDGKPATGVVDKARELEGQVSGLAPVEEN